MRTTARTALLGLSIVLSARAADTHYFADPDLRMTWVYPASFQLATDDRELEHCRPALRSLGILARDGAELRMAIIHGSQTSALVVERVRVPAKQSPSGDGFLATHLKEMKQQYRGLQVVDASVRTVVNRRVFHRTVFAYKLEDKTTMIAVRYVHMDAKKPFALVFTVCGRASQYLKPVAELEWLITGVQVGVGDEDK